MIDLHSHILPALCDGSPNLKTSLAMARIAVEDGITHLACTPHIYPGVYENSTDGIAKALRMLQVELYSQDIALRLIMGADIHMVFGVIDSLQQGTMPTLHGSRYFLLEPSHNLPVPNFLRQIDAFLNAGYVPVITHPERLRWCEAYYQDFIMAARMGAWLQVTAAAISGTFGRTAKRCSERLLLDGVVHIIASDAHDTVYRPPILSTGIEAAIRITGDDTEVMRMVSDRPLAILDNIDPADVLLPPGLSVPIERFDVDKKNWMNRLFC